jgi:hypothetical protein
VGEVADVGAVDVHRARVGVDQPGEQLGERALAGARGPHEGHHAAGLDVEVDPAKHR